MELNRRGQAVSWDLALASFVFFMLLVSCFGAWNYVLIDFEKNQERTRMKNVLMKVTDVLVKSPGEPMNWTNNSSAALVIGLANGYRNVTPEKVEALYNMSHNQTEELNKILRTEGYEFYFLLRNETGNLKSEGRNHSDAARIVKTRRYVLYDGVASTLEVAIWK